MECPVCYELYNLKDREPKLLQCSHTMCGRCLQTIKRAEHVDCPTCRATTRIADVKTNFGLTEAVAQKCEDCLEKNRFRKCHHCGQILCECCLTTHADLFRIDFKKEVDILRTEVMKATNRSMDGTQVECETKRRDDTIEQIRRTVKTRKAELDRLEKELEDLVIQSSDANISKHTEWASELDSQAEKCRSFLRVAQNNLSTKFTEKHTIEPMVASHRQLCDMKDKLQKTEHNAECMTSYSFVASDSDKLRVGEIVQEGKITPMGKDIRTPQVHVVGNVYSQLTCKAITGSEGTGPQQFKGRARIACSGDKIIVADVDNNRIKIYNNDLELKYVFGEEGSGRYQFRGPAGLCCISNAFFVCEELNNRISVFNQYCQMTKMFGCKGPGVNEFELPLGLAASSDGELYVCDDENYRVKVLSPDGKYLRSIGSKGTGPGKFSEWPQRVAVTNNGVVLVTVTGEENVDMFRTSGEYIGLLIDTLPDSEYIPRLMGIAVDKDNNIILADRWNHRLLVLDLNGNLLSTIGAYGDRPGELNGPWEVAINDRGDIIVYDIENCRLQIFGKKD